MCLTKPTKITMEKEKQREIKFRARNVLTRNWEYYTSRELIDGEAKGIALSDWCEYTGLEDIDGKEIYEGDVLQATRDYYDKETSDIYEVVEFYEGGWNAFIIKDKENIMSFPYPLGNFIFQFKPRLVGNIYQNKQYIKWYKEKLA